MRLIVNCLNISRLDDPLVHQGYCFSKLAGIHCCTSFDVILKKKLPGVVGEVVAIKHQNSVGMSLPFHDVHPNGDNMVNWCGFLELLVGSLQITMEKNW